MKKGIGTVLLMFVAIVAGVALRYYVQTGSFLPQQMPEKAQVVEEAQVVEAEDAAPEEVQVAETENAAPEQKPDNDWGVVFTAKDVTPEGMTLVCSQQGGSPTGELLTGPQYEIEKKVSGNWQPAPIYAEVCWEDVAWIIPEEGTAQWQVNWTWIYETLAPGEYRMGKEVMDFRQSGDFDTCKSYAYFTIEE